MYSVIISLTWPGRFDWREFLRIDLIEDESQLNSSVQSRLPSSEAVHETLKPVNGSEKESYLTDGEERGSLPTPPRTKLKAQVPLDEVVHPFDEDTIRHIKKWLRIAGIYFVVNVLVTIILWPMSLYRDYIFTQSFFGGWVTMAIIWHFRRHFCCHCVPNLRRAT